jgi:8-oxo-dGTP pyrophosphatase MutT (NUDIX family)
MPSDRLGENWHSPLAGPRKGEHYRERPCEHERADHDDQEARTGRPPNALTTPGWGPTCRDSRVRHGLQTLSRGYQAMSELFLAYSWHSTPDMRDSTGHVVSRKHARKDVSSAVSTSPPICASGRNIALLLPNRSENRPALHSSREVRNDILRGGCSGPTQMPHFLRAKIGVKGVVFRGGRVLLLHRRDDLSLFPGLWDLPGGGVEEGENIVGALIREAREETGFAVQVRRPLDAWISLARFTSGRRIPSVILCYECSTAAKTAPRLDAREHTEFAWIRHQDLGTHPVPPGQLVAIEKAFASRPQR